MKEYVIEFYNVYGLQCGIKDDVYIAIIKVKTIYKHKKE